MVLLLHKWRLCAAVEAADSLLLKRDQVMHWCSSRNTGAQS